MSVKNTEIDMRGRCSAGQKMLACIVVRLALAECFCNSCGLLVLDEPTTNLDEQNINGLASALGSLLSSRHRSRQFQLIVITHDKVFVDSIAKYQVANKYFEVEKDADGYSRIIENSLG